MSHHRYFIFNDFNMDILYYYILRISEENILFGSRHNAGLTSSHVDVCDIHVVAQIEGEVDICCEIP